MARNRWAVRAAVPTSRICTATTGDDAQSERPKGLEVFMRLAKADVVVENFRPDVKAKLAST